MPARSGRFGGSLAPFGGGVLNLDAAYQVEALTPTGGPPDPGLPPPLQYGGSGASPWDQQLPIVGQTPVPNTEAGAPLPSWQPAPVSATTAGTLDRYIANLSNVASPTQQQTTELATYQARQEDYATRGTPTGVDYSTQIATLNGYIANLQTGVVTQADRDKIALYEARIIEYAAR